MSDRTTSLYDGAMERTANCLAGDPVPWDWEEFAETQARYADLGLARPVS